jgi:hypothetical protein
MALINDLTGTRVADVNADSELKVALPKTLAQAGYIIHAGENHDGLIGLPALRRSSRVSVDKRQAVGMDYPLFDDVFHHSVVNSRKYYVAGPVYQAAQAGGFLILNSANNNAAGSAVLVRSYKSFAVASDAPSKQCCRNWRRRPHDGRQHGTT